MLVEHMLVEAPERGRGNGCACGWWVWGASWSDHVAEVLAGEGLLAEPEPTVAVAPGEMIEVFDDLIRLWRRAWVLHLLPGNLAWVKIERIAEEATIELVPSKARRIKYCASGRSGS